MEPTYITLEEFGHGLFEYVRLKEAAVLGEIKYSELLEYCQKGRIPSINVGENHYKVRGVDIIEFCKKSGRKIYLKVAMK